MSSKVIEIENKKVAFDLSCRGQSVVLTPEQIMAFYFHKLRALFEKNNLFSNEIVISVPSYASNVER